MDDGSITKQKSRMKFASKFGSFFRWNQGSEVKTIIISGKQCPHCVSRGMFTFKSDFDTQKKDVKTNG